MRVALAVLAALILTAYAGGAAQTTRVTIYRPFTGGQLLAELPATVLSQVVGELPSSLLGQLPHLPLG